MFHVNFVCRWLFGSEFVIIAYNDTSLYEGEAYYVKHCTGCKSGYQCVVQTDTPAATTQVTKMMPVAYQGIHLVGKEPKYIFARTAELELKQLECEYEEGNIEYPSCQIHDLPVVCKKVDLLQNNLLIH